jgi:hypothetical protein
MKTQTKKSIEDPAKLEIEARKLEDYEESSLWPLVQQGGFDSCEGSRPSICNYLMGHGAGRLYLQSGHSYLFQGDSKKASEMGDRACQWVKHTRDQLKKLGRGSNGKISYTSLPESRNLYCKALNPPAFNAFDPEMERFLKMIENVASQSLGGTR